MNKKFIHIFMHVPYEGPGCISQWIQNRTHNVSTTQFYDTYSMPDVESIDWLIVMGGPMGVHDEDIYPWLKEEKEFIRESIEKGKRVLGICLGSQLIAEVLGARVYPNKVKEIGWFDLMLTPMGREHPLSNRFEGSFAVFHWHGDTFDLPEDSIPLFHSAVCENQGFIYNNKVVGLQFHLEVTEQSLHAMVENGLKELVESKTIQTPEQIISHSKFIDENNSKMYRILDWLD